MFSLSLGSLVTWYIEQSRAGLRLGESATMITSPGLKP